MSVNRRVILAERPRYIVPTPNCFRLEKSAVPEISDGQILIRTHWLSMDVSLWSRVQRAPRGAKRQPIELGGVMVGPAVGKVERSNHPDFQPGEMVSGFWGWQDYAVSSGTRLRKLDFGIQQASYGVGVYGASGFAAYVALMVTAPPAAGETVVVGTAVGGLGLVAGQIAKLRGCRVVGIAGSLEKCRIAIDKLGFDACIDRNARDFAEQLRAACPAGVDVYVETIGGKVLETVMSITNRNARIVACGLMDTPRFGEKTANEQDLTAMSFLYALINRRVTVTGLVAFDHLRAELANFQRDMKAWIDDGRIKPLEDVAIGLENSPTAFHDVFEGRNVGKKIVKVID